MLITTKEVAAHYRISTVTLRKKLQPFMPILRKGQRKRFFNDNDLEFIATILGAPSLPFKQT